MKKDETNRPIVECSASGLGVRYSDQVQEHDVELDGEGHVLLNGMGMSVAPAWRSLPYFRIPKRLREVHKGAQGSNNTYCFRHGEGVFTDGPISDGLCLHRDCDVHGTIVPTRRISIHDYLSSLAGTAPGWMIDEA
jgi:hypothetical protein